MEFIMTYGWAILAVAVAVAALAYFGIFSPRWNIEQCSFPAELTCIGKAYANPSTGELTFVLHNALGVDMSIDTMNGTRDCESPASFTVDGLAPPQNVTKGEPDTEHILMVVIGGDAPAADFTPAAWQRINAWRKENGVAG